jgi:head-tail adaptor
MKIVPQLNRRLTLQERQTTPDGAGGFAVVWAPLGTLWAEIKPGSGREIGDVEVKLSSVPHRITLRAAPQGADRRPVAGNRLVEGNRIFLVQAVAEADPEGRFLTCFATEEVPA